MWINVEDDLPHFNIDVLIYCRWEKEGGEGEGFEEGFVVTNAQFTPRKGWGRRQDIQVLFWMAMPPLPYVMIEQKKEAE